MCSRTKLGCLLGMLAAGIAGCQGARGVENSQRIAASSAVQQANQPISKALRTGMSAAQVQAIWGEPDVVAEATGGGQAWVYVNVEAVAITVQRNGHTHIWMLGPNRGRFNLRQGRTMNWCWSRRSLRHPPVRLPPRRIPQAAPSR